MPISISISGWSNGASMRARKTAILLLTLLPSALCAEEEQPSLELLEYLGNWEDANGSWVDPQLLLPAVKKDAESDDERIDKQNDE